VSEAAQKRRLRLFSPKNTMQIVKERRSGMLIGSKSGLKLAPECDL